MKIRNTTVLFLIAVLSFLLPANCLAIDEASLSKMLEYSTGDQVKFKNAPSTTAYVFFVKDDPNNQFSEVSHLAIEKFDNEERWRIGFIKARECYFFEETNRSDLDDLVTKLPIIKRLTDYDLKHSKQSNKLKKLSGLEKNTRTISNNNGNPHANINAFYQHAFKIDYDCSPVWKQDYLSLLNIESQNTEFTELKNIVEGMTGVVNGIKADIASIKTDEQTNLNSIKTMLSNSQTEGSPLLQGVFNELLIAFFVCVLVISFLTALLLKFPMEKLLEAMRSHFGDNEDSAKSSKKVMDGIRSSLQDIQKKLTEVGSEIKTQGNNEFLNRLETNVIQEVQGIKTQIKSMEREFKNLQNHSSFAKLIHQNDINVINQITQAAAETLKGKVASFNQAFNETEAQLNNLAVSLRKQGVDISTLQAELDQFKNVTMSTYISMSDYKGLKDYFDKFEEKLTLLSKIAGAATAASDQTAHSSQQKHNELQGVLAKAEQETWQAQQALESSSVQYKEKIEELEQKIAQITENKEKLNQSLDEVSVFIPELERLSKAAGFSDMNDANDSGVKYAGIQDTLKLIESNPLFFSFCSGLITLKNELLEFETLTPNHPVINACNFSEVTKRVPDNYKNFWSKFCGGEPHARSQYLIADWHLFFFHIWRADLIVATYWPDLPGLRTSFRKAKLSIEPLLSQHAIKPHDIHLLGKPADIAVPNKIEIDDNAKISEFLEDSEIFQSEVKQLSSQYTIVCDIRFWGIDTVGGGNDSYLVDDSSYLICRGKEAE